MQTQPTLLATFPTFPIRMTKTKTHTKTNTKTRDMLSCHANPTYPPCITTSETRNCAKSFIWKNTATAEQNLNKWKQRNMFQSPAAARIYLVTSATGNCKNNSSEEAHDDNAH